MYNELDFVALNRQLNEKLPKGTGGIIHEIRYGDPNLYLIEFFDENNDTISIESVKEDDIDLVRERDPEL